MEQENKQLTEISQKLDQLIALFKLSNRSALEEYRQFIKEDKVYEKLLETTEVPISYSELSKKIHDVLGVAEITVKRKIADLRAMGLLVASRQGREVYYENSRLLS